MSEAIAAKAYEATKPKEDPAWGGVEVTHRERLVYQADRAIETGKADTDFEKKAVELSDKETAKADKTEPAAK